MLDRMISMLFYMQGLGMFMSAVVAAASTGNRLSIVAGPLFASPALWCIYAIAPLSLIKSLSTHEQISDVDNSEGGDTQGIRYDDVATVKGQVMEMYECPLLPPDWTGVGPINRVGADGSPLQARQPKATCEEMVSCNLNEVALHV